MPQRVFQTAFHVPGTLSAALDIKWTAPFDCTLIHVSAVGSNSNTGTLEVGTSADANGYITSFSIGDSGVPVEKEALADFDGALAGSQYPRISDGDIIALALTLGGTAPADFTCVLTFLEG